MTRESFVRDCISDMLPVDSTLIRRLNSTVDIICGE